LVCHVSYPIPSHATALPLLCPGDSVNARHDCPSPPWMPRFGYRGLSTAPTHATIRLMAAPNGRLSLWPRLRIQPCGTQYDDALRLCAVPWKLIVGPLSATSDIGDSAAVILPGGPLGPLAPRPRCPAHCRWTVDSCCDPSARLDSATALSPHPRATTPAGYGKPSPNATEDPPT
jgi:hypothetical protein